jgi:hypothetical protein
MTQEEIDMKVAIDNVLSEFQAYNKIENMAHIEFIKDAYKKVSGSMMRNYAREVGGQKLVDEIDRILGNT